MKRSKALIYVSTLISIFGCTIEQTDIEDSHSNITDNSDTEFIEGSINENQTVCLNELYNSFSFNAFVLNDVTLESGDTEGPIAMGGDLTIKGTFTVATQTAGSFFDTNEEIASSLVINGQTIYKSSEGINLNNGYVKVGDLTGSNVYDLDKNKVASNTRITPNDYNDTPRILLQRNQVSESIDSEDLIDFETAFALFNDLAIELSELEENIVIEDTNKITLNNDTTNVLNLTGDELNNLENFTFNNQPTEDSLLVINVDNEGEFVWNVQNQAGIGDEHGNFIIYNFFNSSQITIKSGTTIMGSIFAPYSDIIKKSSDNINGQVIAKSYIHKNGELHHHPFEYCDKIEEEEQEICSLSIELKEKTKDEGSKIIIKSEVENLTYEWSTGETTSSIYVNPDETTIYSVVVTDKNNCETTSSIEIIISDPKDPVDKEGCMEEEEEEMEEEEEEMEEEEEEMCSLEITLREEFVNFGSEIFVDSESEDLTYEWSTGETTPSIYVEPFTITTYSVIVTDENGCEVTSDIVIYPAD